MEDGLRVGMVFDEYDAISKVLILVLVEDGLREDLPKDCCWILFRAQNHWYMYR